MYMHVHVCNNQSSFQTITKNESNFEILLHSLYHIKGKGKKSSRVRGAAHSSTPNNDNPDDV